MSKANHPSTKDTIIQVDSPILLINTKNYVSLSKDNEKNKTNVRRPPTIHLETTSIHQCL